MSFPRGKKGVHRLSCNMLSRHFLYHCRTSAKEEIEKEERERRDKVAKGPKGTLGVRCFPPPLKCNAILAASVAATVYAVLRFLQVSEW